MARKSASLLTKTQRRRIQDDFAELDEEKKRRDQQRIRERIQSGVLDFGLLADYPDDQFEMAFDDVPDEDVREALADTYLVVERLRELEGYDRDALIRDARGRGDDYAADAAGARTLDGLDLQTSAEIRETAREQVREQLGASPWERRANSLLKFAAAMFLPVFLMVLSDATVHTTFIKGGMTNALAGTLFVLGFLGVVAVMIIKFAHALKYSVLPGVVRLVRDPEAALRDAWETLRSPERALRESWRKL